MRSRFLAGAAAALAVLVSPAQASPPSFSHDLPTGSCNYMIANTNPLRPSAAHFEGEIDCHVVWRTRNNAGAPTTTHAVVTATLQTERDHDGGGVLQSCTFTSNSPAGFAVVGACVIGFTFAPTQLLFLCVTYTWTEPTGHFSYTEDFDPVTPGRQCR